MNLSQLRYPPSYWRRWKEVEAKGCVIELERVTRPVQAKQCSLRSMTANARWGVARPILVKDKGHNEEHSVGSQAGHVAWSPFKYSMVPTRQTWAGEMT